MAKSKPRIIIFLDMRGFTRLAERAEVALAMEDFLDPFYSLLMEYFQGSSIKYLGDGAMVLIKEQELDSILENIFSLRQRFDKQWQSFTEKRGIEAYTGLSFGVARGPVLQISQNTQDPTISLFDYVGSRINLASRLCSFARPQGIVVHRESFPNLPIQYEEVFNAAVFKNIPGLEKKDVRCWVEKTVEMPMDDGAIQLMKTEVHVSGLAFRDGKLLLCQRGPKREIDPSKWSGPGGKILPNSSFEDSLRDIFQKEVGIYVDRILLIDTYFIDKVQIPGLIFYCQVSQGEPTTKDKQDIAARFFAEKDVEKITTSLSPKMSIVKKAFDLDRKMTKLPLRSRLILTRSCDLHCKYCHHEHLYKPIEANETGIKKTLERLSINFDLFHLTVSGGEPLMPSIIPDLGRLLKYVRDELEFNGELALVSHGLHLTEDILQMISKNTASIKIDFFGVYDDQVSEYVGMKIEDYATNFMANMKMIQDFGIPVSINMKLRRNATEDIVMLIDLLNENKLRPKKIKLIEMVRPLENNKGFDADFLPIEEVPFYNEEYINPANGMLSHKTHMGFRGQRIEYYRYPCHNLENCANCFGSWDIIIKPDGTLQVCERAVIGNDYIHERLRELGIQVDMVDYRAQYNLSNR